MSRKQDMVRVRKEIVLREEDDGAFLFDPDSGRLCYLNEVGIAIWKLCRKPIEQDYIIEWLAAEYPDISDTQLADDCTAFLNDLDNLGFLASG